MSVGSVGGSNIFAALQSTTGVLGAGSRTKDGGGVIATAAKALGMSTDDVVAALKSGQSLDDLAQQQGVSHDDLVSAIKAGMPADVQSSGKADQMAEAIVSRKGMPHGHHRPPPPPDDSTSSSSTSASSTGTGVLSGTLSASQTSMLDQLSSLLGTSTDDLVGSLKSGESLSDLLKAKGVDGSTLANIVQGSLYVDTTA